VTMRVGIAGLGTVGLGVLKCLQDNNAALAARAQRNGVEVIALSARDEAKDRGIDLSKYAWESDPVALAARDDVDVIIELIGGSEGPARNLVAASLKAGKHVVTANKALLAYHGIELAKLAEAAKSALKFEAAVCGGIPIVKSLREGIIAYDVSSVRGILNGTCNYILTEMEACGRAFEDVVAEAQQLGYAEADPTLDIGGGDTAHKLSLLASLAFGTLPDLEGVSMTGIEQITPADIAFADEFGYRIKLLGAARRTDNGIEQRVHPTMVRKGTPLGDTESSFNAVEVKAGKADRFFFSGRGAGEGPTASAVISDLIDVARGTLGPVFGLPIAQLKKPVVVPPEAHRSAFYLRFQVLDVPGVMAGVSQKLADEGVSIDSMLQRGRSPGEAVSIVMLTHEAPQAAVERALSAIAQSDKVFETPCMIPMETAQAS
jgi:homoserine dehydrogenase